MIRQVCVLSGLLVAVGCAQPRAARPGQRTTMRLHVAGVSERDTASVRRWCLASADTTVSPDSMAALTRHGCVLRDQRVRVF